MAKSKAVKQAEALERKRKLYPQKLDLSARSRFGGDLYDKVLVARGKDAADENNKHAQLLFSKYLKEAQLNADGTEAIYSKHHAGKHRNGYPDIGDVNEAVNWEFGMQLENGVLSKNLLETAERRINDKTGLGASILEAAGHTQSDGIEIEPYHQAE